jgi:LacI family transcriptional regulator
MSARRKRSVTIRDVARLSGVSIATVTRAFQGSPLVRPETIERVREAAEKLGYRPDSVAQALATGHSNTVGVLVPSLLESYWGEIADAIEHRAGELGYSVVLASSRGEPERERAMLDVLFGKRLNGIIVAGVAGDPRDWPDGGPRRPPLVLLEWDATPQWDILEELSHAPLERMWRLTEQQVPGEWLASVAYDDIVGGTLMARHLLELGHTDLAFIAGSPVRTCLLRLLGIRSSVEEAGHRLRYVRVAEDSFEGGRVLGAAVLAEPDRPTAFVCYSDVIAIGLIRAAHDLGLDVPGDVSVSGYDDIEIASYLDPPLTTIRNPKTELGELALELLLRPPTGPRSPIHKKLTGSLVARESTDRPPRPQRPAMTQAPINA